MYRRNLLNMKILSALLIVFCFGCEGGGTIPPYQEDRTTGLFVKEIDSCEYVIVYGNGIVHKQNCKYCEQRKFNHTSLLANENSYFIDSIGSVMFLDTTTTSTWKAIK